MKKIALCAAFLCGLSLLFAGGSREGSDSSLDEVLSKGTFVMGLDDSFPPMGFRNDSNEIVGYDVDLAREVCARMGVRLVLQPVDWSAKEMELNTKMIDCIWNGFTMTAEREEAMLFSEPYLQNAQVVVVRSDSPYSRLADLAGCVVGVQAGSSAQDALDGAASFKASLASVAEFRDNLTALLDLELHGIDAVVMDLVVAEYSIKTSGKDFRILDETLSPESFGVGFRKGDAALRDRVQEILEEMAADGTAARISREWFGSDISAIGK